MIIHVKNMEALNRFVSRGFVVTGIDYFESTENTIIETYTIDEFKCGRKNLIEVDTDDFIEFCFSPYAIQDNVSNTAYMQELLEHSALYPALAHKYISEKLQLDKILRIPATKKAPTAIEA